ncbi:uncharacterized protein N7515_001131 [Penicillium bovifimosum]|uniref:Uncharacterized protein n=1 Tax=Penicillium bovifimosum TaxID=126998 RepID=A0A9W9HJI6_9EURO|nr:uncharacterized protein N7515_001131 [Penicillium bovifimosum]KAJ5146567.1 hypothetical protein N7515_001131 [Penicillium bovifimosum]
MRVHMQVPHPGTEYGDIEDLRLQANLCRHTEVQALMDFHNANATMTPALLGIKVDIQGSDGCVPGGYIVFIVFEEVPGIRLADDQSAPYPGFPLHTFFRRFERKQRDVIREQFDKADRELAKIDWLLDEPWADHLVWDSNTSKLYFINFRMAHSACWLRRPQSVVLGGNVALATDVTLKQYNWELFGLAICPGNSKHEGNLSIWKL